MDNPRHCWLCGGECRCHETPVYRIKRIDENSLVDELVAALADVVGAIECGDYYNDVLLSQANAVLEKARKRYD